MSENKNKEVLNAEEAEAKAQSAVEEAQAARDKLHAITSSADHDPTSPEGQKVDADKEKAIEALAAAKLALKNATAAREQISAWHKRRGEELDRIRAANPEWADDADFWKDVAAPENAELTKAEFPGGIPTTELGRWADGLAKRINARLAKEKKEGGGDGGENKPGGEDDPDPGKTGAGGAGDSNKLKGAEKKIADYNEFLADVSSNISNPMGTAPPSGQEFESLARGMVDLATTEQSANINDEGSPIMGRD